MPKASPPLRYVLVGSGDFAADLLRGLAIAEFLPVATLTRTDRPAGRGRNLHPTPFKVAASELGIPVGETQRPGDASFLAALEAARPDVVLVSDYGSIVPQEVLAFPPRGCVNVHPSLLPRHRGAAPIRRALMEGDAESGVSLMLMDEGLDTGPVIAARSVVIEGEDDELSLRLRLASLGASMVVEFLPSWVEGIIEATPQGEEGASYASLLRKDELVVDWSRSAREIHNLVRALSPRPGAHTFLRGRRLKILRVSIADTERTPAPGELITVGGELLVGTGDGSLQILLLQPEGKRSMSADEFLRGYRPRKGERLG